MIPENLRDNTTIVKNHSIKTHIFCILLRIIIGLLIITNSMPKNVIQIICIIIILMFSYKFVAVPNVWKVYLRTIISYAVVLFLITKYDDKYNSVAGTIIIMDSLMGLQSRHIFEKIGFLIK